MYEKGYALDYTKQGDSLDSFAQKYMNEIDRIYKILNEIKTNTCTDIDAGQLKVENGVLYIRNTANTEWINVGLVAKHLGLDYEAESYKAAFEAMKQAAATSEANAAASATAAATSETNAATSATSAAEAAEKAYSDYETIIKGDVATAQNAASAAENFAVAEDKFTHDGTEYYSSKWWANQSKEIAFPDHFITQDKLVVGTLGYVAPEMFGAKADGVTDDTSAIQQAIDAGIAQNKVVLFQKGDYKLSSVMVNAPCVIEGNNANLIYNGVKDTDGNYQSVIIVKSETTGFRGVIRNLRIDCANLALSALEVKQNINVFAFECFNIRNVITYGIYCNGGSGEFRHIRIQGTIQTGITSKGVYCLSSDYYFDDLQVVNCLYGFYTTAIGQLHNYHPWNSYAELMKTGVGLYNDDTTVMLTNSYIDTMAICFDGTGTFFINGLLLYWSTEYYTDIAVGDSTTLPCVFGDTTTIKCFSGVRLFKPRGRSTSAQYVNWSQNRDTAYQISLLENNLIDGQAYYAKRFYDTPTVTFENGFTSSSADYIKRYNAEIVEIDMVVSSASWTNGAGVSVFTLPAGYRPKENYSCPIAIGDDVYYGTHICGSLFINQSTGKVFITANTNISSPTTTNLKVHIRCRFYVL